MVLKDGRIVEQGSHKELLELDGLFASMWADQISASEDPKTQAGYEVDVGDDAPVVDIPEPETRSTVVEEIIVADSPQVIPASLEAQPNAPIAFPISNDAPQAFPTTASVSDTPSIHSHPELSSIPAHVQGASVTFDAKATTPPRMASPEPRRGLSTHNIQRLARKISLSGKAPKLPALLRRDTSMREASMASSGSVGGSATTPPTGSARESVDEPQSEALSKKEDKKKKRKSFI
ncbi:hypothetical protein BDR04DRAFT_1153542 [Suillus decipiens]|nr:hypothetical protein BDR04DRAFT_1153542 [Suillus decipiens]